MYSEARNAVQVMYTLGVGVTRKIGGDNLLSSVFFGEGESRRTASFTKNKGRTSDRRLRRGSKRFLASLTAKVDPNKLLAVDACYGSSGKRLPAQTST